MPLKLCRKPLEDGCPLVGSSRPCRALVVRWALTIVFDEATWRS
jgi:hypothetical protein